MSIYISPDGNPEIWQDKPHGYHTPEEWDALHPDPSSPLPPPSAEERIAERIVAVRGRLAAIDAESIRPLRAIACDSATDADREKLTALEAEAGTLREELADMDKEGGA